MQSQHCCALTLDRIENGSTLLGNNWFVLSNCVKMLPVCLVCCVVLCRRRPEDDNTIMVSGSVCLGFDPLTFCVSDSTPHVLY